MMVRARINRLHLVVFLSLTGVILAATAAATPGVSAGAMTPTVNWVIQAVERPAAPLVATASAGTAPTEAWADVQPGRMRARASCGLAVGEGVNAMAYADYTEHFHLSRPGLPNNTTGDFLYRFYLSGTMRILATGVPSYAQVVVGGNAQDHGVYSGRLEFERIGSQGVLYAYTDTLGGEEPNIFAGPRGARKIYGVVDQLVSGPEGWYYTINVRVPVQFAFRDFPCNESPLVDDGNNWAQFSLNCSATAGATSDFSSTFEFTAQNPIVPDPADTSLPPDGWTFTTGSGELTLPSPLGVACATGTGDAFFLAGDGQIIDLRALDGSNLPSAGRPATDFTDGFFGFDLTGLAYGETTSVTITLPGSQTAGMRWWYPSGMHCWAPTVSWSSLDVGDDDGDRVVILTLIDGGPGEACGIFGGVNGMVRVLGGLSPMVPQAIWLAEFTARERDQGVDLLWRTAPTERERFSLTAQRGSESWTVTVDETDAGAFAARDENVALAAGGRVTYALSHDGDLVGECVVELAVPSARVVLWDPSPNPFNPGTRISFMVPHAQRVRIGVYDLAGRLVTTLTDAEWGPGDHALTWDGDNDAGHPVPSGTYAVHLRTDQRLQSKLVSLVR